MDLQGDIQGRKYCTFCKLVYLKLSTFPFWAFCHNSKLPQNKLPTGLLNHNFLGSK
uniref:Uncharacterized protein n=1 Tax=Anguilla anguilla TaxID=7936 RepID=A0A0E9VAN1_ANGAN